MWKRRVWQRYERRTFIVSLECRSIQFVVYLAKIISPLKELYSNNSLFGIWFIDLFRECVYMYCVFCCGWFTKYGNGSHWWSWPFPKAQQYKNVPCMFICSVRPRTIAIPETQLILSSIYICLVKYDSAGLLTNSVMYETHIMLYTIPFDLIGL